MKRLVSLLLAFIAYLGMGFSPTLAYAEEKVYSTVLEDLTKDESFKKEEYPSVADDYSLLPQPSLKIEITAEKSGYIERVEAKKIGLASQHTGAGRATKEDDVDLSAGIVLNKKVGDHVETGEVLAVIYGNQQEKVETAAKEAKTAFAIGSSPVDSPVLIKEIIGL